MASTAELIRREEDILRKAKNAHRIKIQKLEETEFRRIVKILKKTEFFETDFSDDELLNGFNKMVEWKKKRDEASSPNTTFSDHSTA